MIYLTIDTNNWIYLANSRNPESNKFEEGRHVKLLETLRNLIDEGHAQVLSCPLIIAEWKRNEVHTKELILKYKNQLKATVDTFNIVAKSLEDSDLTILQMILQKYEANINAQIKANTEHIEQITNLIQKAIHYEISDKIKAIAADWAVARKAPFIGEKKNSMADALIFLGAVNYLKELTAMPDPFGGNEIWYIYPSSIFVSANKGDFSDPSDDGYLHPDLRPLADEIKMNFFPSLPKALNYIQQQIQVEPEFTPEEIEAMEKEIDEVDDGWYICHACDQDEENVFRNQVYFSEPYKVPIIHNEYYDPNQLGLELPNLEPTPPQVEFTMIKTGDCSWCNTTHLWCIECDTVTALEGEDEDGFNCSGCDLEYVIQKDKWDGSERKIFVKG